jgi:LPXTG-motif cell wall-anchored protein
MGDIIRLIEGLIAGDPTAQSVLVFTVIGTIVIVGITMIIRRRRK